MNDDNGKMPEVRLVNDGGRAALVGFEEFDEWAVKSLKTYGQVTDGMRMAGMSGDDRLRMLCARLAEKVQELAGKCVRVGKLDGAGLAITQLGKIEADRGLYDVGLFDGMPCVYSRQSRTLVVFTLEELFRQALLCKVDEPLPQAARIIPARPLG